MTRARTRRRRPKWLRPAATPATPPADAPVEIAIPPEMEARYRRMAAALAADPRGAAHLRAVLAAMDVRTPEELAAMPPMAQIMAIQSAFEHLAEEAALGRRPT